jgi:hypothetical protein
VHRTPVRSISQKRETEIGSGIGRGCRRSSTTRRLSWSFYRPSKVGLVALLPATPGMFRRCSYKLHARISSLSSRVDALDRDDELWVNIVTAVVIKVGRRCSLIVIVSGMLGRRRSSSSPRPWSGTGLARLQMGAKLGRLGGLRSSKIFSLFFLLCFLFFFLYFLF